MENAWFRYFIQYDPAAALRSLTAPTLALFGALDVQVPADINAPLLEQLLEQSSSRRRAVETVDRMNHVLQVARTGAVSEYARLEKQLHPAVATRVLEFVRGLERRRESATLSDGRSR
jgi:hypothetical protein